MIGQIFKKLASRENMIGAIGEENFRNLEELGISPDPNLSEYLTVMVGEQSYAHWLLCYPKIEDFLT